MGVMLFMETAVYDFVEQYEFYATVMSIFNIWLYFLNGYSYVNEFIISAIGLVRMGVNYVKHDLLTYIKQAMRG